MERKATGEIFTGSDDHLKSVRKTLDQLYAERHQVWVQDSVNPLLAETKLDSHLKILSEVKQHWENNAPNTGSAFETLFDKLNLVTSSATKKSIDIIHLSKNMNTSREELNTLVSTLKKLKSELAESNTGSDFLKKSANEIRDKMTSVENHIITGGLYGKLSNGAPPKERKMFLSTFWACLDSYIAKYKASAETSNQFPISTVETFYKDMIQVLPNDSTKVLEPLRKLYLHESTKDAWFDSVVNLKNNLSRILDWNAYMDKLVNSISGSYDVQQILKGRLEQINCLESYKNPRSFMETMRDWIMTGNSKCVFGDAPSEQIDNILDLEKESEFLHLIFTKVMGKPYEIYSEEFRLILSQHDIHISDFFDAKEHKLNHKNVFIFARGTIFIDKNLLDTGGSVRNLVLCANEIEVIAEGNQTVKIFLTGKKGEPLPDAKSGLNWGKHGDDGANGNTGGPGGNIYIISKQPSDLSQLFIKTVGGQGGKGQNGGDGHSGSDDGEYIEIFYSQLEHLFDDFSQYCDILCNAMQVNPPVWKDPGFIEKNAIGDDQLMITPNAKVFEQIMSRCAFLVGIKMAMDYVMNDSNFSKCLCSIFNDIITCDISLIDGDWFRQCEKICKNECKVVGYLKKKVKRKLITNLSSKYKSVEWKGHKFWLTTWQDNLKILKAHRGGISSSSDLEVMIRAKEEFLLLLETVELKSPISEIYNAPINLFKTVLTNLKNKTTYTLHIGNRTRPTNGGDGGNGGNGGLGGAPGQVLVYPQCNQEKNCRIDRPYGVCGAPGDGGLPGANGNVLPTREPQPGKPGNTPRRQDPTSEISDAKWDPHKDCNLNDFTSQLDYNQRELFISILASHHWALENVLSTEFFVNEFLHLSNFLATKYSTSYSPFTKAHLKYLNKFQGHLESFYQSDTNRAENDHVLQFLRNITYFRRKSLEVYLEYPPLIVDLSTMFETANKKLKSLEDAKLDALYGEYITQYMTVLTAKIEKKKRRTKEAVSSLLAEVNETFKRLLKDYTQDVTKCIEILKKIGFWEKVVDWLNLGETVSTFIAIIPNEGTKTIGVVGKAAFKGAATVAEKMKPKLEEIGALKSTQLFDSTRLLGHKKRAVADLKKLIENMDKPLKDCFFKFSGDIDNVEKAFNNCDTSMDGINAKLMIESIIRFSEIKLQILKTLEMNKKERIEDAPELAIEFDILYTKVLLIDSTSAEIYSEPKTIIGTCGEKISEKTFGETKDTKNAEKRQAGIQTHFEPVTNQLLTLVNSYLGGDEKSAISEWKFEEILSDLKSHLEKFVAGLPEDQDLKMGMAKIKRVMNLHYSLWSSVNEWQEMKDMELLHSKTTGVFEKFGRSRDKVELEAKALQISFFVQGERILMEYITIQQACLQWAFPYSETYMGNIKLYMESVQSFFKELEQRAPITEASAQETTQASTTKPVNDSYSDRIHTYISNCQRAIQEMQTIYSNFKASTNILEGALIEKPFTSEPPYFPFYTWLNTYHSAQIRRLLSGYPTKFWAPVMQSGVAAVKVNGSIHLKISVKKNKEMDNLLQSALKSYELLMTHSGVSFYRMGSQYYVMRNGDEIPLLGSAVVENEIKSCILYQRSTPTSNLIKLKMKDFIMSPYCTEWTFQLLPANREHIMGNGEEQRKKFETLADKFAHCVDLQLIGLGRYLDENLNICEGRKLPQNLNDYYEAVGKKSELYELCTL